MQNAHLVRTLIDNVMKLEVKFLSLVTISSLVLIQVASHNTDLLDADIVVKNANATNLDSVVSQSQTPSSQVNHSLVDYPLSNISLAGTDVSAGFGSNSRYFLKVKKHGNLLKAGANQKYSHFEIGGDSPKKYILLSEGFSKEDYLTYTSQKNKKETLGEFKTINLNSNELEIVFLKPNDEISGVDGSKILAGKDQIIINVAGSKKIKFKTSSLGISLIEKNSMFSVTKKGVQVSTGNKTIRF